MSDADFFEFAIDLPDEGLAGDARTLLGVKDRYMRLAKDLRVMSDAPAVQAWGRKHYGGTAPIICTLIEQRYPLFVLAGDVGTGKTAFAKMAANQLATDLNKSGTLFGLSTRVRGEGRVGQVSTQLNRAFEHVAAALGKNKLCVLLIDEADSLVTARSADNTHIEDKIAVNTIIQKVDGLRSHHGRLIVFLATNSPQVVDTAVERRAAAIEVFDRPNGDERRAVIQHDFAGIGLRPETVEELVRLTDARDGMPPFTYSDLRTRLLPRTLLAAYPDRRITDADAVEAAQSLHASRPVQ